MNVQFFEEVIEGWDTIERAWTIGRLKVAGMVLTDENGVVVLTTLGNSHHEVLEYVMRHKLRVVRHDNAGGGFITISPAGEISIDGVSATLGDKPLHEALVQPTIDYVRQKLTTLGRN